MKIRVIFFLVVVGMPQPSSVRADGGTLRLSQERGGFQVSVFTSPTPPRVGPLDVSVLVQEISSGRTLDEIPIKVIVYPRAAPEQTQTDRASKKAATNKLMQAVQFPLNQAGPWHVEVVLVVLNDSLGFGFDIDATEATPAWVEWGMWLALPYTAFALYLVHRGMAKRRANRGRPKDNFTGRFR